MLIAFYILAIPLLLKQIELSGALVTIDAMGCQKEIARGIAEGRAPPAPYPQDAEASIFFALSEIAAGTLDKDPDFTREKNAAAILNTALELEPDQPPARIRADLGALEALWREKQAPSTLY